MLAAQTHKKTASSDRPQPNRFDAAQRGKEPPKENPVWQALALRPFAIQRKLAISQPNDPFEQEADRVAERVMRMPATPSCCGHDSFTPAPRAAQRKCASCEDEEEKLQRKDTSGQVNDAVAPRIVNDALSSPGRPLSAATRAFMEPRFGHDFSQVRVHAGSEAARSARSVNALAYTVGHDIVFGNDRSEDETAEGRTLLAHELAHVVQQSQGSNESTVQRWTIEQCNSAQSDYITDAIARGFNDLTAALALASVRPITDNMRNALWLAFRNSSNETAELVTNNVRHLRNHLTSSRYRCQPSTNPSCGDHCGYVDMNAGPSTPITYICMPTFSNFSFLGQARCVIHEAAHQYLGVSDTGYFSLAECAETPRVTRPNNAEDDQSGTAGDNPIDRLNNADAYACFVHYLTHMPQAALTSQAADYRGENLQIDQPQGTRIYTETRTPDVPLFTLQGVPANSGFWFRWALFAGGHQFNLESTRSINTGEFYEDNLNTPVFIPSAVRRILGREHITSGVILSETQLFRSAGDRFAAPVVRRTVTLNIVEGQDPFDLSRI